MDISDLQSMTDEFGEGWAGAHVRRLFKLIDRIDTGLSYDREALAYAVWLHDWGAFPRFRQTGVEHGLRSRQVAEAEIMPYVHISVPQKKIVLDAIEVHDYRCVQPAGSQESVLLREADFLDFLGAIGVAREFAWGPNQLRKGVTRIQSRRDGIRGRFTIPAAQAIAEERLTRMEKILEWIDQESFGEL